MPHVPWHHRWALIPACCLLHGCLTGDVPLLSSGEANFKYHKHDSTVKVPFSTLPDVAPAPPQGALGSS